MTLYTILPWIAALGFGAVALTAASRPFASRWIWSVPAILSAAFFSWSVFAIVMEGGNGFWAEHVRNAWGNQIWFDLLIGVGVAWVLLVPKARAAGMTIVPWLALILVSGGIGLLAMFARYLYLRDRGAALPSS